MIQIRKVGYLNFFHYWDGITPTAKYGASDLVITFDGNIMYLRATNGRVVFLKDGFNYTSVEVYDDTTSGSWTSFANVEALQQKLIDLGHPAYAQQGEIIQPENFTDLADTPSTYVGQSTKVVRVKADETGLEFVSGGGGGGGVESVTGDSVDNTDPLNPVVEDQDMQSVVDTGGYAESDDGFSILDVDLTDGASYFSFLSSTNGSNAGAIYCDKDGVSLYNTSNDATVESEIAVYAGLFSVYQQDTVGSGRTNIFISDTSAGTHTANVYIPRPTTAGDFRLAHSVSGVESDSSGNISLKEENLKGTALYSATTTGAVNIDCAIFGDWYRILTGNTTLTFTNTPASGESFVRSMIIKSTATETLAFANATAVIGTYTEDTTENELTIKLSNFPTVGLKITVYINQP